MLDRNLNNLQSHCHLHTILSQIVGLPGLFMYLPNKEISTLPAYRERFDIVSILYRINVLLLINKET
jgi:hypothetical protein